MGLLRELRSALTDVVERTLPSTLTITSGSGSRRSSGSGFAIDEQGHVVTNFHVVEHADGATQTRLPDGRILRASIVGVDPHTDLAILRTETPTGSFLQLRNEPAVLGEPCLAFGSPKGVYTDSVSFGIISGLHRSITSPGGRPIEAVIQTDAAINPGNSGGPLVDGDGNVLGVNTSAHRDTEGIGFAVPASTIEEVTAELLQHGEILRSSLNVSVRTAKGLDPEHGARLQVAEVKRSDSALTVGDVILDVDGIDIRSRHDMFRVLNRSRVDQMVEIGVIRAGKVEQVATRAGTYR